MRDDEYIAEHSVTLLGGGPVDPELLDRALRIAPKLVAADGGANHAHVLRKPVKQIVGDLDSLTNQEIWHNSGVNLTHLDEQQTTDFEKCLYTVETELYLGVGFIGGRLDHTMACLATMAKLKKRRIVLLSEEEVVFRCPAELKLEMAAGARVSLFPMTEVKNMKSKGLKWSLDDLILKPDGLVGTSNEATGGTVELVVGSGSLLAILPINYLSEVIGSLVD